MPVSFLPKGSLDRTKGKYVMAALEKIKDDILLFRLLSLMMGHWIIFVSKICINSSAMSSRFYPCALESGKREQKYVNRISVSSFNHLNYSVPRQLEVKAPTDPENLLHSALLKLVDGGESQRTFVYIKDAIEAVLLMILRVGGGYWKTKPS